MTTTGKIEVISWQAVRDICHQARYDALAGEPNYMELVVNAKGVKCHNGYDKAAVVAACEWLLNYYKKHDEELPDRKVVENLDLNLPAATVAAPKKPTPAPAEKKEPSLLQSVNARIAAAKAAVQATTTDTPVATPAAAPSTPMAATTVAVGGNSEPPKTPEPEERPNSLPNSQTIVKPIASHQDDFKDYPAVVVQENIAERPFDNYPIELRKPMAYFVNYNKIPINDKAVTEILPDHSVLEDTNGKGRRYLGKWKSGELCRNIDAAVHDLTVVKAAYASKYPGEIQKCNRFGVGMLGKKIPNLLFFEWDDVWVRTDANGKVLPKDVKGGQIVREDDGTQYVANDTFGQLAFYQYCVKMGYHVARSFSGNMHYVMELPECYKNLPAELLDSKNGGGFKWLDGKDEGDFEIANNHNSQWNETGYTLNVGSIIPATDAYAVAFVKARMDRALQRLQADGKKTTRAARAAPQASGEGSAPGTATATTTDTTVDAVLVNKVRNITTGKLGRLLHKIDIEPGRKDLDLSAELQSLCNLIVMQGVTNYETCHAILDGSAIHRAYAERPDYREKWTENKLRRTFDKAYQDVGTRIFRAYKHQDGETRKEIVRAIARFNELEDNAIFYSEVYGRLVKLLDDGRVIVIDDNDLKCELTTQEYLWLDENGKATEPTIAAIKSCVNVANLPKLYYRTSGGWVTTDGQVINTQGYHDGYYLDKDIEVRPIPAEISYNELRQAREILERAFKDVKYKTPDGLQDTVYALIATFLHPSLKHALFAVIFNKNKAGIGGSTIVKCLLQLRHNVPINEPVALTDTERETKEIMTAELSTHTCGFANFDNLTTTKSLGIPGLMLHSGDGVYKDRMKYGRNTTAIDTNKDVIYNGNNIIIAADFCRRVLEIRLYWDKDTSTITFGSDGQKAADVYENTMHFAATKHSEVLWAVAVAIQAWIQAGRPYPKVVPTGNWSEYSSYHKIVGGAMDMLGYDHYLQHLHETQLDDNYAISLYKERIDTLHEAFMMYGRGQTELDGTVEYETRDFCAADLYAAMHPSRIDTADLAERLREFEEGKQVDATTRTKIPASFYQQDLIRLFGDTKGKSLTTVLQGMVREGIVTDCKYCLIEVIKQSQHRKWFRVVTVRQREQILKKQNTDDQADN